MFFPPAQSTLRSSTTRPRRDVSVRLISALVLSRLDYCNAVLISLPAVTMAPLQSSARSGETRARLITTRPCNSRPSGVALASYNATNRAQIVSSWKALIGQAPDYITNLLMLVTIIPSRSSLCASSNGHLFQPRTMWRIGAFSVAAPCAWNRLPTELRLVWSSTATFSRHLKSFLFCTAYLLPYVMYIRADCRRRTTNSAVTVTMTNINFTFTQRTNFLLLCSLLVDINVKPDWYESVTLHKTAA